MIGTVPAWIKGRNIKNSTTYIGGENMEILIIIGTVVMWHWIFNEQQAKHGKGQ